MTQKTLTEYQSSGVECPKCGYSSKDKRGVAVHWRHNHSGILPWMKTECDQCGEIFKKKESHRKDSDNDFCSRECNNKWLSENATAERSNLWTGGNEIVACSWCGETFERKPSHVKEENFCSQSCYGEWQSEHNIGDNNPAWTGGVDYYFAVRRLIDNVVWEEARKECRERHNHKCAVCGVDQSQLKRKLDVHHIVPVLCGGTNGQYNLIPLCQKCHGPVESYTKDIVNYEYTEHRGDR